jgi:DNA processing protein
MTSTFSSSSYFVLDRGALGNRLRERFTDKQLPRLFGYGGFVDLEAARPAVAVVGSRDATRGGVEAAREIGWQMASAGWCVISGGARGIDRAAHEGAFEAGGAVVAVLGETAAHFGDHKLAWLKKGIDQAPERGLMASPYGPEDVQKDWMFADRNRVIAGLADAVVVVEGRPKSGTLHTIEAAVKLGVPLWAVGGTTAAASVPIELVEKGQARLLRPWDAAAMIAGAALAEASPGARESDQRDIAQAPPGPLRDALLEAPGGCLRLDDAIQICAVPVGTVLSEAGALELQGFLSREGSLLVARKRTTL